MTTTKNLRTATVIQARPRKMSKDPVRTMLRRQQVFEAIAETMAKRHWDAITLDEAAGSLSRTKGTIYYYFKSKGEMLYQLQMYAFDILDQAVNPILKDSACPPRERLEHLISAHVLCICDRWQMWRALRGNVALRQASPGQIREIRRRIRSYQNAVNEIVREVIQTEGSDYIDPALATRLILGTVNSLQWYRRGGKLPEEELAKRVTKFILDGLLAKPS